jgi:hypothetical protein
MGKPELDGWISALAIIAKRLYQEQQFECAYLLGEFTGKAYTKMHQMQERKFNLVQDIKQLYWNKCSTKDIKTIIETINN